MLDRYVWQRPATVVLAALVVLSINTFSPVGNDDGPGITIIQTKKKIHQLPNLLDQRIAILVGLDVSPNWVRKQSVVDSLVYGIVKPDGTIPAGISKDYGHLVTGNHGKEISLFFRTDKKKVTIKYVNHGGKLHIKAISLSQPVEQSYRTKKQCQQVNKYTGAPRTE